MIASEEMLKHRSSEEVASVCSRSPRPIDVLTFVKEVGDVHDLCGDVAR